MGNTRSPERLNVAELRAAIEPTRDEIRSTTASPPEKPQSSLPLDHPEVVTEYLITAGFPDHHAQFKISARHERWSEAAYKVTRLMCSNGSLALLGPPGTGKTQMATAAAHMARANFGVKCKYRRLRALVTQYRTKCYSNRDGRDKDERKMDDDTWLQRYCSVDLLVIDELDKITGRDVPDIAHTIQDYRHYTLKRPTIWIGNCGPDELTDRLGPTVVDRINEAGGVIPCDWESFR